MAETRKSGKIKTRSSARKRKTSFNPEVHDGTPEDPRLSKRRKVEAKSYHNLFRQSQKHVVWLLSVQLNQQNRHEKLQEKEENENANIWCVDLKEKDWTD